MIRAKDLALAVVAGAWAVLEGVHGILYALLALIVIDLLTGVMKSLHKGEAITSQRLRATPAKLATYLLTVLAIFAADYIVGNSTPILTRVVATALMLIELKSLDENLKSLGLDVLGAAIAKLKPAPKPEAAVAPPAVSEPASPAGAQTTTTTTTTTTVEDGK